MPAPGPGLTVVTYRFLRLAMVVLVVLLLVSVLRERFTGGAGCFEVSISAYWFTPVQGVFTAALVALGVCMIVIKATDGREDLVLALGGMLAVVVGIVPTSDRAVCSSNPLPDADVVARVDNNMWSVLLAGLVGVVIAVVVARRQGDLRSIVPAAGPRRAGTLAAAALLLAAIVWFVGWRDGFVQHAHDVAAVGLFGSIVAVVGLNAWECRCRGDDRRLTMRYLLVLVLMVVLGGGLVVSQWLGFEHWLLAAEAVVIGLFAVFWLVQTDELWDAGPRPGRRHRPVG